MENAESRQVRFVCDAMLGGLARWLRAAGYDASWQAHIEDRDLVRQARQEERMLLSSDSGIFEFAVLRDGDLPALFIPRGLGPLEQLRYVLTRLHLGLHEPRCMACGGELIEIPKDSAAGRVPPRTFDWQDRYWECRLCGRVFWHGTHWQRITQNLQAAVQEQ
jgi:uncharacterized protein